MISSTRPLPILGLLVLAVLSGCAGESKGVNTPPTADLVITPGSAPNIFVLDGSKSMDPDGDPLSYHWNWVLGNTTTDSSKIEVEFPSMLTTSDAGYLVSLIVRDDAGEPGLAVGPVAFGTGDNDPAKIGIKEAPRWVKPGTEVTLDAGLMTSDLQNDELAYEWIWGPRGSFDEKATGVADPCAESDSRMGTFSTGCLAQNEAFNQTFDQEGVFTIHCHPHPWMKARIVVAADSPTVQQDYEIADMGFPDTVTVGVGSALRFINLDPVEHTATIEDWTPGGRSGGTEPVFKQTLDEGEYIVRLIVTDATGERATATWGLKASSDAPENPLNGQLTGDTPLGPTQEQPLYYNTTFQTDIIASLTWEDVTGAAFDGTIEVVRNEDGAAAEQDCAPERTAEPPTVTVKCQIPAGDYLIKVVGKNANDDPSALPPGWNLGVTGIVLSKPGFGDSLGDGHAHHH